MNPRDPFKIIASRNLDHDHRHIMGLLYLPIIGQDAFSLYHVLYTLVDRASLHSKSYPHSFLSDIVGCNIKTLELARQKLEAVGLLESYYKDDDYLYELYLPLSAEMFIKDSMFAPYLLKQIGNDRFEDLIQSFKIKRIYHKEYDTISVGFSDVFNPAYEKISTRSQYLEAKQHPVKVNTNINIDLVIDSLPDHLVHPTTKTKKMKEKLEQFAYTYSLKEEDVKLLLLKSLNKDQSICFETLSKEAQKHYQTKPKHQHTKKSSGYNLTYFKSVHPTTIVEDLTGMHAPSADLKIIERLMTQTDLKNEVINVLIAYVLKELDNQFPVYNYFEKIVAEWKRKNIETAEDAIEHIKQRKQKRAESKKQKPRYKNNKSLPEDVKVDWFDDYLKEYEKGS
ncbi:MAG: DnaD domain protein [Bacillota bacterium]